MATELAANNNTPRDVNGFIKSATSGEFSAKDFRTWGATLLAAVYLAEEGPPAGERDAKRKVASVVKRVAEHLGNTPAVCRNSYIHPSVLDRYAAGVTLDQFRSKSDRLVRRQQPEYEVEELALLRLLRGQAPGAAQPAAARKAA